jgi:hypothetical protein
MTPNPSTLSWLIRAMEAELQLRGAVFDLSALIAFATWVWPLARLDPDVPRRAAAFVEAAARA